MTAYQRPKGSASSSEDEEDNSADVKTEDEDPSELRSGIMDRQGQVAARGESKVCFDDFEPVKVIGCGCFGKVTMVVCKKNGKIYAMKSIRKAHVVKNKKVRHTQTERNIMQQINHPFVMRMHYAFQNKGKLYMVMDYLNGGDLFYHLSLSRRFTEDRARFYAAEVRLVPHHSPSLCGFAARLALTNGKRWAVLADGTAEPQRGTTMLQCAVASRPPARPFVETALAVELAKRSCRSDRQRTLLGGALDVRAFSLHTPEPLVEWWAPCARVGVLLRPCVAPRTGQTPLPLGPTDLANLVASCRAVALHAPGHSAGMDEPWEPAPLSGKHSQRCASTCDS